MKSKILLKIILSIVSLSIVVSCSGVFASWIYAEENPVESNKELPFILNEFYWQGAEELPEDSSLGENHVVLIEKILNGTYTDANGNVTNIGLNNPNSYISKEIENRSNISWFSSDTLGSMDYWERDDISKYFDTATTNLTFLIYFPEGVSDTYYLFTTSVVLGEDSPNIPIGQVIYPIYRTTLVKNAEGVWEATETSTGFATSSYYENPITGSWLVKYPSFDPTTWNEGKQGTASSNAIYSYVGQTITLHAETAETKTYYKIVAPSNTNIKVSSEDSAVKIIVYNSGMSYVTAREGAQASNSITFKPTRNSTYYIEVYGATTITFNIT